MPIDYGSGKTCRYAVNSNVISSPFHIHKPIFASVILLVVGILFTGCSSSEIATTKYDTLRIDLAQIDSVVQQAIERKIFPGAVVQVILGDSTLYHKAFGYHDYEQSTIVTTTSVFDVASITKVMATTLAIMDLHDQGVVNIYDPVAKYLPEFDTPEKRAVTIYQLMIHTSGLPAFRVYVDQIKSRSELIYAIKNEPLIQQPGEYLYSDVGLILCGLIVENLTGERLDTYLEQTWFRWLGLKDTTFNPKNRGERFVQRVLPTEIDTVYRHKLIHGEVHDERAWYMDGVAGHAGLFSTTDDIAKFSRFLKNNGKWESRQLISEQTVSNFISRQAPLRRRGIGFDLKSIHGFSSAGSLASDRTFGHTGFTGTSFWIDPDRDLAVIILTNRTFPYRNTASGIAQLRSDVADIVQLYVSQ